MIGLYHRGEIDYGSIQADNFSTLKFLAKSPLHFRSVPQGGVHETRLMGLGAANHVAVLEPEVFVRDYVIWEDTWQPHHGEFNEETNEVTPPGGKARAVGSKRVKNGGEWRRFQDDNPGKTILSQSDFDAAIRFKDALRRNRSCMRFLAFGSPEVSMVWRDEETGVLLRGRVDWLTEHAGAPCIADLKGTSDITPGVFATRLARSFYHAQQAMYHDGYMAITGKAPTVVVVACEMREPHDGCPYLLDDDVLDEGREIYRGWLKTLIACRESDRWPGIAGEEESIASLRLPAWAYSNDGDVSGLDVDWE